MITLTLLAGWLSDPAKGALPRGTVCLGLRCSSATRRTFVVATAARLLAAPPSEARAAARHLGARARGHIERRLRAEEEHLDGPHAQGRARPVERCRVAAGRHLVGSGGRQRPRDSRLRVRRRLLGDGGAFVAATLVWVPLRTTIGKRLRNPRGSQVSSWSAPRETRVVLLVNMRFSDLPTPLLAPQQVSHLTGRATASLKDARPCDRGVHLFLCSAISPAHLHALGSHLAAGRPPTFDSTISSWIR